MGTIEKKNHERCLVQHFFERLPQFKVVTIEDHESPDFLARIDGQPIGVELTLIFKPTAHCARPLKEQEALQDRVIEEAKRIHIDNGGPNLWVSAFWLPHDSLDARLVDSLARWLAQRIGQLDLEPGETTSLQRDWDNDHDDFPETVLDSVTVSRHVDPLIKHHWYSPRAGWEMGADADLIQAHIDRKNIRCSAYRKTCNDIWLERLHR